MSHETSATIRERAALWMTWLAGALLVAGVGVRLWPLLTPVEPRAFPTLWEDDSYYSLNVARNIMDGLGEVLGGRPTNGFQPLYVWVLGHGPRLLGIKIDAERFVDLAQWFQFMVSVGQAWVVWAFARSLLKSEVQARGRAAAAALVVTAFVFASPSTIALGANGLETRLASLALLGFAWAGCLPTRASLGANVGLGVLAALAFIARVDAVFFLAALGVSALWRERFSRPALTRWVTAGGVCALLAAPYLAHNYFEFGAVVPLSGLANELLGAETSGVGRLLATLRQVAGAFTLLYYAGDRWYASGLKIGLSLLVTVPALALAARALWSGRADDQPAAGVDQDAERGFGTLLLACVLWLPCLVVYYGWIQRAGALGRYMEPVRVFASFLALVFVARAYVAQPGTLTRVAVGLLVVGQAVALAVHAPFLVRPPDPRRPFAQALRVMDESELDGGTVGVFQSGYLGYWFPNVVNLDGKVNTAALDAIVKGELGQYVVDQGFLAVTDPAAYFHPKRVDKPCELASPEYCVLREDPAIQSHYRPETRAGAVDLTYEVLRRATAP